MAAEGADGLRPGHGEGRQSITVNEKGKLLRKAFLLKAEQGLSNQEIIERLAKMGLKLSPQTLHKVFANPFYCGVIAHGLLEGEVVEGRHEQLVSMAVFLKVNNIQARNAHGYSQQRHDGRLPLRTHLQCARCGTNMTGYEVKKKKILYYKCNTPGCRVNKSARQLHELYREQLQSYAIDPRLLAPLREQLLLTFRQLNEQKEQDSRHLRASLKSVQEKLDLVEERFVLGEITKAQFEKFGQKLREEKRQIEGELGEGPPKLSNLEKYLDFSLKMASEMGQMWVSADFHTRQRLQRLVFPEGVAYDKEKDSYRTERTNSVFLLISSLSASCEVKKKGKSGLTACFSPLVAPVEQTSNFFIEDLKRLARLVA